MFSKLKNFDSNATSTYLRIFHMVPTNDEQFVHRAIEPETSLNHELRQQEKKELQRWVRSVQTHTRLRALSA